MTKFTSRDAVLVSAKRTPIGRAFKGSLTGVRPEDLAVAAIQGALAAAPGVSIADIEDLYLG
jgi:acetyl-CoA C-acetyltransferase